MTEILGLKTEDEVRVKRADISIKSRCDVLSVISPLVEDMQI